MAPGTASDAHDDGPSRHLTMIDGFKALSDEKYFIQRYKYYSTHEDAVSMTFEEHLEDLDLLIKSQSEGRRQGRRHEGTSNDPIDLNDSDTVLPTIETSEETTLAFPAINTKNEGATFPGLRNERLHDAADDPPDSTSEIPAANDLTRLPEEAPQQGQSPAWIPGSPACIPETRAFPPTSPIFSPHSPAGQPLAPVIDIARLSPCNPEYSLSPAYSPTSPPAAQFSPPTITRKKSLTPLLDYEDYEGSNKSVLDQEPVATLESQVWNQPRSFSSKRNANHFDEDDDELSVSNDDTASDVPGSHRPHKARKTSHSSSSVTLHDDDDAFERGNASKGKTQPTTTKIAFMHKGQTTSARKNIPTKHGSPHSITINYLKSRPGLISAATLQDLQDRHYQARYAHRQSATASRIYANLNSGSTNGNPRSALTHAVNPPSILLPNMVWNPHNVHTGFASGHVGHNNKTTQDPTAREDIVAESKGGNRCACESGSSESGSNSDGAFGSSSSGSENGSSEFWGGSSGSGYVSGDFGVERDDLANGHNESLQSTFKTPAAPTADTEALPSFAEVTGESNNNLPNVTFIWNSAPVKPTGSIADELRRKISSTGPPTDGRLRRPIPWAPRLLIPTQSINQPARVYESKFAQGSTVSRTEQKPNNSALKHMLDSPLVSQAKPNGNQAVLMNGENHGQGSTFPKSAQNPDGYNPRISELAKEYVRRCEGGSD